ncbi:APOBEC1 complementation factor-like [Onthophagus taurus]|uniref:APOBEC1 complementation factor-like n=1 Tax=Onthophagus taurus TaxID=166361 RepID=UPI0039BDFAA0
MEVQRNLFARLSVAATTYRQERLKRLSNLTGCKIIQKNGQRILQAHPLLQTLPESGSEIFVAKLPPHILEDEILPLFESIGPIYKMRLMLDFNGNIRGYGFISYYYRSDAYDAVRLLNGSKIFPEYGSIVVSKSVDNRTLFIGHIPDHITKEDLLNDLNTRLEGIFDIMLYPSRNQPNLNRGYAFVKFDSHENASKSRKILRSRMDNNLGSNLVVEWADPEPDIHPTIMPQVKKLFIRNIDMNLSRHELLNLIRQYVPSTHLVKVYTKYDYAFVHFVTKEFAENALITLQGRKFGEKVIDVQWARPKSYSKPYPMPINFCKSVSPKLRKEMAAFKKDQVIGNSSKDLHSFNESFLNMKL